MSGIPLIEKIDGIRKIYKDLDADVAHFQQACGFECLKACGHCCENPRIEITELEMLPIAAALLEQGTAEDFYARAEQQDFKGRCIFFEPELKLGAPGHCGIYEHRPLICRLFSSSGNTDKSGKTRLVVCSLIKETQAVPFQQAAADVLSGRLAAPVMGHYNMRIMAVDAELARENLSINSAFKRAIERIFMHKKLSGTGLSSFVKE